MGLSLLESLGAAPREYESVLTEAVMTSILNGWHADSWGALARVAKLTESLSRLLVEAVGKKTEDLSRMIRQRQADQAIALVRAVALPSLYETLLAGCEAVCDGPRRGEIVRNRLFDECEEHRTRALLQLAACAPESAALSSHKINELLIDVAEREEHTGWHRYERKIVEQSILTELPAEIRCFANLTKLSINNSDLEYLPDAVGDLSHLEVLSLVSKKRPGRLRLLPDAIGRLSRLRELWVERQELDTLPDSIGQLVSLHTLSLVKCELKELPESIGNLDSLVSLSLSECPLQRFPESIGNLRSLEALDLSGTQLKNLPPAIGQLGRLKKLDLSGCLLTHLPDTIGGLESLEELDLSDTQLQAIPGTIRHLRNLKVLILPKTVVDIPLEVGFLPLTRLKCGRSDTEIILSLCRRAFDATQSRS